MTETALQFSQPCRSVRGPAGRQPVRIARLERADYDAIVAMLGRCSTATLQHRFHGITNGVSYVTRLLTGTTDEIGYAAWLAGRCVGLASLHVADEAAAQMAVLVEDQWQQRGIGSALVSELIGHARRQRLCRLRADVQADNRFIPSALARLGPTRTSLSLGVYTIWLDLVRPGYDAGAVA
jgi:GNAT superfamily N-acetyltransferase